MELSSPMTLLAAVVITLCAQVAPRLASNDHPQMPHFKSLSGGIAVSYVFLELLPELDKANELIGTSVYVLALVGFVAFYAVEHYFLRRSEGDRKARQALPARVAVTSLYMLSVGYSLAEEFPESGFGAIIVVGGLMIHVSTNVIGLAEVFGDRYRGVQPLLPLALLLGALVGYFTALHKSVIDILTALTAGFVMFQSFREELGGADRAYFPAFFLGIGVTVFSILV